uniref:Uncharacterized protein n=1 Tax=Arundo donax TaxID=35708 RepID=A0A0A9HE08_ARUDO
MPHQDLSGRSVCFHLWSHNNGQVTSLCEKKISALSIQLRRSASARRGGGRVTPESSVKVLGTNCCPMLYVGSNVPPHESKQ